ncbi:MAG TPA: helix-turn-helix domain-containing protein [Candidatus Thermoplasmatota archaeon]|nr:helix-turn-helix domain-containing protein [Candidatus Thermoplasmatota archaeon]
MSPTKRDDQEIRIRRLDIPCRVLGITVPPGRVNLKMAGSSTLALAAPEALRQVQRWLEAELDAQAVPGLGIAPRLLRIDAHPLPPAWERLKTPVAIDYIQILPCGLASLFLRGTGLEVRTLLIASGAGLGFLGSAYSTIATVSPRQQEALATAAAMGYYELPHRTDLRRIGAVMRLSSSGVSELLRRGEVAVLRHSLARAMLAEWRQALSRDAGSASTANKSAQEPHATQQAVAPRLEMMENGHAVESPASELDS